MILNTVLSIKANPCTPRVNADHGPAFLSPTYHLFNHIASRAVVWRPLFSKKRLQRDRTAPVLCSRLHQPPPSPCRVALQLQYDGTHFHGWERKPDVDTVQSAVERAISGFYGRAICVQAASRTDAGAHALAQVVHFDAPFRMSDL